METFCYYQMEVADYEYGSDEPKMILVCEASSDRKECPYSKAAKAMKRCATFQEEEKDD